MSQSPESLDRVVERLLDGDHHSRREFVRRLGAMGAVTSAGAFLAACGGVSGTEKKQDKAAAAQPANHPKTAIGTLVVSNWPLYIDKKTPKGWQKAENAKLSYTEDINENDEFFAKVRQQLEAGQAIDRDLVVLTDWMAARWVDAGYTEKIDKRNVPNAKNLLPALQHPGFDRNRDYTLPWQSGITAIGYNPKKTGAQAHEHQRPVRPEVQGPRLVHLGLARLGEPRPAGHGQEDRHGDQGRPPGGDREARQGQQGRPDPPVHGQRLRQGPRRGEPLGLHGLLRRHRPAAVRQPASSSSSSPRRAPSPGRTT